MAEVYRTADDRFEGLPDFGFAPCYREAAGLRLAHLDEGDGAPVIFFHGEPTWSYLWRKTLPPVRDAGFRCVVPDLAGFGRSDKPTDVGWYSYDRHTQLMAGGAGAARPPRRGGFRVRPPHPAHGGAAGAARPP